MSTWFLKDCANVHRGVHSLSQRSTAAYENARQKISTFFGIEREETILTRGTTDGLNLVATILGEAVLKPGDEVLVTELEHHSNFIPWQRVCERVGATLKMVEADDNLIVTPEAFEAALTPRTKVAAFIHLSNTLGVEHDVDAFAAVCRERNVFSVVDGAQATVHATTGQRRSRRGRPVSMASSSAPPSIIALLLPS